MMIENQLGTSLSILENNDLISISKEIKNGNPIYIISAYNGDESSCIDLGSYTDKEDAKEILSIICEKYQYCQECKYGDPGIQPPEFVFQMPKRKQLIDEDMFD